MADIGGVSRRFHETANGDPAMKAIVARVRSGDCHRKPSAVMLTNVRDWGRIRVWQSYQSQGDVYVPL